MNKKRLGKSILIVSAVLGFIVTICPVPPMGLYGGGPIRVCLETTDGTTIVKDGKLTILGLCDHKLSFDMQWEGYYYSLYRGNKREEKTRIYSMIWGMLWTFDVNGKTYRYYQTRWHRSEQG